MMIFPYVSKADLTKNVGQRLRYDETSIFGPEYTADGTMTGSNRPSITGIKGREFFAQVTTRDGLILKVT